MSFYIITENLIQNGLKINTKFPYRLLINCKRISGCSRESEQHLDQVIKINTLRESKQMLCSSRYDVSGIQQLQCIPTESIKPESNHKETSYTPHLKDML